jgi:hypothetical protein
MTIPTRALAAVFFLSLATTACLEDNRFTNEAMLTKAAQLTKLSSAVESTVRYKNPPADLDDQGLLKLATQHDPQLLANFEGLKVRVLTKARHSVVLVCTEDGQRGLMEDAACTVALDRHLWKDPLKPCEFSVDTTTACPAP